MPTPYDIEIAEASRLFSIPARLIRSVIAVESGFKPDVVSGKGAVGLMQLMPGTARDMGVVNPYDPRQNVLGGVRLLRVLANNFGGGPIQYVLAAYYMGETGVRRAIAGRGLPNEARDYLAKVHSAYQSGYD